MENDKAIGVTVEEIERQVDISFLVQPRPQYLICTQGGVPIITEARPAGEGFIWCNQCKCRRMEGDRHALKTVAVFSRTGEL